MLDGLLDTTGHLELVVLASVPAGARERLLFAELVDEGLDDLGGERDGRGANGDVGKLGVSGSLKVRRGEVDLQDWKCARGR